VQLQESYWGFDQPWVCGWEIRITKKGCPGDKRGGVGVTPCLSAAFLMYNITVLMLIFLEVIEP